MNKSTGKIKYFYIITMSYFLLGFINISFAMLALACMMTPFFLLFRYKEKTWCKKYCPRADYLSLFRVFKTGYKTPKWLTEDKMKKMVLQYFCINLFFIIMSTIMVSRGSFAPIENIRFLIAFQFPGTFPQLWSPLELSDTMVHFSFRLYSVMFTSTVLGTILAILYKPRTWCAVCPVNTLSSVILKSRSTDVSI
jgi:4Fe-4S binding domain